MPARSSLAATLASVVHAGLVGRIVPMLIGATLVAPGLAPGPARAATVPAATDIESLPAVTIEQPAQAASAAHATPSTKHARHARLETIDTASLSAPIAATLSDRVPSAASLVMEAHATTLRPAPLPDQDFDAPGPDPQTLAAQQEASLAPSVYGQTQHFSGDGFSSGSNLESNKNNRRRPGGGMSLSIPVP